MLKSKGFAVLLTAVAVAISSAGARAAGKPTSEVKSIALLPLAPKAPPDAKQAAVLGDLLLSALQGAARGMRVLGQSDVDR